MIVLWVIYGLIVLVELSLLLRFSFHFKKSTKERAVDSPVSVLVCARNEAEHLPRLLNSLLASDYDLRKVEILVGDDQSTDDTKKVIENFAQANSCIKYKNIEEQKDGLIAKGNVLAQLVDAASFEKILIIDADMKVTSLWLKKMTTLLGQYDLVSGLTMVDKDFHRPYIQFFDWTVVLHSMKVMADAGSAIAILGNNMGFRLSAYNQLGGFRALGPSDVEDLGLLRMAQKAELSTFQYVGKAGKAYTKGQEGWLAMLEQRCRWMNGVFAHHWLLAIPALFARLWFIIGATICLWDTHLGGFILVYGFLVNGVKYFQLTRAVANTYLFALRLPALISLLDTFALARILVKGKVAWKGRKF